MLFQVQSEPYTGPMDLLLDLLDQSKIDIYDINISQITEQFLEAMQRVHIPTDELSDFIRMASFLVLMKAKTLIKDWEEDEDEESISREELIARLKEYQIYKFASGLLKEREDRSNYFLSKWPEDPADFQEEKEEPIPKDPQKLKEAIFTLLDRKKENEESLLEVERIVNYEEYSYEEVGNIIRKKLLTGTHFTFTDLMDSLSWTKANMVSAFLSLLEINKGDSIRLSQDSDLQKIEVEVLDSEQLAENKDIFKENSWEGGEF